MRHSIFGRLFGLGASVTVCFAAMAGAQTVPTGFTKTNLITNVPTSATSMVQRPDGSILIAVKEGTIRVFRNGAVLPTPFHTFTTVDSSGEGGVIGITVGPDYNTTQYVYVRVSRGATGGIVRLRANGDKSDRTETLIFSVPISGGIHQGGGVHFAPDGSLFFTVGETGNSSNAPLLTNLLGKIMRIWPDGTIPTDNPFYQTATGDNRAIWAKGLRNPFTFAFQPGTGKPYINNVGTSWEEINVGVAGADYGWPATEGDFNPVTFPAYTRPLYWYQTSGNAIIGAAFYKPLGAASRFPAQYAEAYFFADYVRGWIKSLNPTTGAVTDFGTGFTSPVDLMVAHDGRLLVLQRTSATIVAIDYSLGACCNSGTCVTVTAQACGGTFNGVASVCSSYLCCAANYNQDAGLGVQDIFSFLADWFAGRPRADFNGINGVDVGDIFAFLDAWFAGC